MLAPSSWWFPLCVFISTSEADTCVFTHRQQWTQGKCWFVCRQSSDEPHKEKVLRENQIVMKITTRPASLWKTFFNIYTGVCGDLLWNSLFISQYCSTLISLLSAFNLFVKHSFGSTPDRRNPWINIGNAQRDGVVVFFSIHQGLLGFKLQIFDYKAAGPRHLHRWRCYIPILSNIAIILFSSSIHHYWVSVWASPIYTFKLMLTHTVQNHVQICAP